MESPVLRSMAERSRLRVPRPPPYLIDRSTGADCAPRACDWRGTCRDSTGPKAAAHRRGRGRFGLAHVALPGDHRLVVGLAELRRRRDRQPQQEVPDSLMASAALSQFLQNHPKVKAPTQKRK